MTDARPLLPERGSDGHAHVPRTAAGGDRGGVAASRFVGREQELARIESCFSALGEGAGRVIAVAGESGIGKTRLANEVAARMLAIGGDVLIGRCSEPDAAIPYLPFVRVANETCKRLRDEDPRWTAEADVERFLQIQARPATPGRADGAIDRLQMHDAVWELLAAAAKSRPMLIVLDDFQWADQSSLSLLTHIADRIPGAPIVVLVLSRGFDKPSASRIEAIPQAAELIYLDGLTREQVSELLADREGHTFPGRERMTAEAVHRLTAGNPLFVGELVRHLESETTSEADRSAWLSRLVAADLPSVPPALTEVVERRLDALPSLARSILSQAAVLGLQFDFDVLAEMADLEEDVLLDALGDAAHAEILFEARDGVADFEFRHEIVRQVLYTNLSRPRRQRMHLRAAQALESVYAASIDMRLAEISHHYRAAGRRADQRRTAEYSLRAAMRAQDVFAYPEAVEHLQIALAAFEESGGSMRERADVLDRMAGILYVSGGSRELGIQCAERALRLYEQLGEHQRIAQAHSRLMWQFSSYPEVVDMPRARAQFEAAKGILGDVRDRIALGYFFIGQAGAALWEVRTPEGLEASNQALGVAERLGDQALWASAAGMRGWHLAISGRLREGRELLERAWQAADTKGHFIWSFRAAWYHGTLTFLLADPWESCTWLQRELARPHLDAALLQKRSLLERLGHSLIAIGDMERAAAVAQELGPGNIVSAHLQYRAGEWEAAMEGFLAAQARVVRAGDAFDEWLINHRIASVASALGETGTAVAVLSRNLEISADGATTLEAFTRIRMAMVVAPGSADCADGHLQRAVELLHNGEDWRGLGGQIAMAKGAVAAARGDRTEAIGELEVALREFERLRIPWEVAEVRLRLAALGVADADEHLRQAGEIHERCGTPGFWARRLATLSPAMKGATTSNSHGLSGRELEVLALLGRGLSNKEIADELVISPHTVAKHVSAILAKTGVRSRSGAAALAISEGAILPH